MSSVAPLLVCGGQPLQLNVLRGGLYERQHYYNAEHIAEQTLAQQPRDCGAYVVRGALYAGVYAVARR